MTVEIFASSLFTEKVYDMYVLQYISLNLQGRGIFPCETSVVDIHSDLDWNPDVTTLGMWPLHIYEDGNVIFFR